MGAISCRMGDKGMPSPSLGPAEPKLITDDDAVLLNHDGSPENRDSERQRRSDGGAAEGNEQGEQHNVYGDYEYLLQGHSSWNVENLLTEHREKIDALREAVRVKLCNRNVTPILNCRGSFCSVLMRL